MTKEMYHYEQIKQKLEAQKAEEKRKREEQERKVLEERQKRKAEEAKKKRQMAIDVKKLSTQDKIEEHKDPISIPAQIDEKKSNYSQEDTDKSDKESLYGVPMFSHLN